MDSLIPKNTEIERGISNITQQALCLKVVDRDTYYQAGELRKAHANLGKNFKSWIKEFKDHAYAGWKKLCKAETDVLARLNPGIEHLDKEMLTYEREQEKLRQAEEERLYKIACKEVETQQIKDALGAEKEGNKEEAEAILNEEPHVPTPIVAPSTPKIAGLGTVTNWKFRIVDESKIPHHFMMPNLAKIGGIVRQMKSETNIEGIEAYSVTTKKGVRS